MNFVDPLGLEAARPPGNGGTPENPEKFNNYNQGVTSFYEYQQHYAPVEGVGVLGGFRTSGYVSISGNQDGNFTASATVLGSAPGASSAGEVEFFGVIEITSNGQSMLTVPLSQPSEAHITDPNSTMIGTAQFLLPPEETPIDFQATMKTGYILRVSEGRHTAGTTFELPIFKEED
ncbi:hypothetical protein [Spirochaeta dissipatitropha]